MDKQGFETLVTRLEQDAHRHPRLYRLRVVALALLGYGYLAGVLLVLIAMLAGALASIAVLKVFALKIALPIAGVVWAVLRAMWVRIAAPEGQEITRQQAPELFDLVDGVRSKLQAPKFHRVLITRDFNASVVQVPRLGVLGWHRNYLMLGLPLMKTLTRAQFTAVLAHEFGHLAGGHGRLGNWIYRLRMSWARLQQTLQGSHQLGSFVFRPFVERFIPYFTAYSFPLARSNEFEADAVAARITSPQASAEALTSVNVMGYWLGERFWPRIHAMADRQPAPSYAPYTDLGGSFDGEFNDEDTRAWLQRSMERQTSADDTHPSLAARLAAIGQPARLAPPAAGESADRLLGAARAGISAALDEQWKAMIEPSWSRRYEHVSNGRKRLAELDTVSSGERSFDQAYEHATLTEEFGDAADAALEEFRSLQARSPDSALAALALGRRLLIRGDAGGVALAELALKLDKEALPAVAENLRDYYWRSGDQQQARLWHERLVQANEEQQQVHRERETLKLSDKFEAHRLSEAQLAPLLTGLRTIAGLRKVYLVRKTLKHRPDLPLYVLGYCVTPWWSLHRKKRAAAVQQQIVEQVNCPTETFVVNVEGDNYRFHRKLRFRRGARIL